MNWRKSKYGVAAAILVSGAHGTGVGVWEGENQKALVGQEQEQQHGQGRDTLSELL